MNENWIRENMSELINAEDSILVSDGVFVHIDKLVAFFSSIEPTYDNLVNADQGKGYKPMFDRMKEKGIIN